MRELSPRSQSGLLRASTTPYLAVEVDSSDHSLANALNLARHAMPDLSSDSIMNIKLCVHRMDIEAGLTFFVFCLQDSAGLSADPETFKRYRET